MTHSDEPSPRLLKATRVYRGWLMEDVARAIGRSRAWLSGVESGKRVPPQDKQRELEQILRVHEDPLK